MARRDSPLSRRVILRVLPHFAVMKMPVFRAAESNRAIEIVQRAYRENADVI